jgi:hypothetical protein
MTAIDSTRKIREKRKVLKGEKSVNFVSDPRKRKALGFASIDII